MILTPATSTSIPTIAIWHGYLLRATGSNIYTYELVRSWVRAGWNVVLACQERDPSHHPSVHDVIDLQLDPRSGQAAVSMRRNLREPAPGEGRCSVVVPDIGGRLPVYVLDRYEGFEVRRVVDLTDAQLDAYAHAQAAAMRWVCREFDVDGVLINHAAPLPAALAPVLCELRVPFAVKVHGSELEYALIEDDRLVAPAAHALRQATKVLVGSDHIERRTRELLGDDAVDGRVESVPPGVDLERFRPLRDGLGAAAGAGARATADSSAGAGLDADADASSRDACVRRLVAVLQSRADAAPTGRGPEQAAQVVEIVDRVARGAERPEQLVEQLAELHTSYEERHVDRDAAVRVTELRLQEAGRVIAFVGKLIPQKGVHLLLAALPDVLARHPDARVIIAGFGPMRDAYEAMLDALALGDAACLDALADGGGALSGEGVDGLPHLRAWLDDLRHRGELDAWLQRAIETGVRQRVTFLGLVDHDVLAELWPLAEISIVPSVLAEAFGMVAAEATACGSVPIVADHSGLADAAAVIGRDGVEPTRFVLDPAAPEAAVTSLAEAIIERLDLAPRERARQAAAARANVADAWSWDHIAARVAAFTGRTPAGAAATSLLDA